MISAFAAAISNSSCDVRLRARFRPDRQILKSRDAPGNRRVGPQGQPSRPRPFSQSPTNYVDDGGRLCDKRPWVQSTSSAEDWPARKLRGKRRIPGFRWFCMRCGPSEPRLRTKLPTSPSSFARTPSDPTTPRPMRSGSCIARCALSARSSFRAPTPTRCRPEARLQSIATASRKPSKPRFSAHPLITLDRGEIAGLPPEDWDSVIVATGPAHLAGAGRGDRTD